MSDFEPKVVCFSCKFGWGYLADEDTLSSQIKNWIPIVCSGKVDAKHVMEAFEHGADGVLILGCPEGECHYQDGNFETKKRVQLLRKVLDHRVSLYQRVYGSLDARQPAQGEVLFGRQPADPEQRRDLVRAGAGALVESHDDVVGQGQLRFRLAVGVEDHPRSSVSGGDERDAAAQGIVAAARGGEQGDAGRGDGRCDEG